MRRHDGPRGEWMRVAAWRVALAVAVSLVGLGGAASAQQPPPLPPATQAQPPPLPPVQAATAGPSQATEHGCDPSWFARVYRSSRDAVVRIDSAGGTGAGFVFHSRKHVATAFHVVDIGRDPTITLVDGRQIAAEVVVADPDNDLAILELEEPVQVAPLPAGSSESVDLGTPVLVIGHPYATLSQFDRRLKGLLSWSVSQGILSGKSPDLLQTDAAINPGNSGGPLLGCDGRVLGVISAKLQAEGLGFVIPVRRLTELTRQLEHPGVYRGRWSGTGPMVALAYQLNPDQNFLGFSIGLGVVAYDRWATTLRFGLAWEQTDEPLRELDRSIVRMSGELDLHYRFLITTSPIPIYLTAGGGGAIARDSLDTKRVTLIQQPGCTTATCPQRLLTVTEESSELRAWPMAGVGLEIPSLIGGYSFLVDVEDIQLSVHRFLIGFSL